MTASFTHELFVNTIVVIIKDWMTDEFVTTSFLELLAKMLTHIIHVYLIRLYVRKSRGGHIPERMMDQWADESARLEDDRKGKLFWGICE